MILVACRSDGGRTERLQLRDLCLNIGKHLFDQTLAVKEWIVGDLVNGKCRRFKRIHRVDAIEIDSCCMQPPKLAQIDVKSKACKVKLMEVTVLSDLVPLKSLKNLVLLRVQIHLGEFCDGT